MRLQRKLFYSIIAVTVASMLLIYIAAAFISFRSLEINRRNDLAIRANELGALAGDYVSGKVTADVLLRMINNVDDIIGAHVWVFNKYGKILLESERGPRIRKLPDFGGARSGRVPCVVPDEVFLTPDGHELVVRVLSGLRYQGSLYNGYYDEDMIAVAVPFYFNNSIAGGVVLFSSFSGQTREPIALLFYILAAVSVLVIVITILVSRAVAGSLTKPIKDLTAVANRFSEGDFSTARLPDSDDEIGELGMAFAKMAEDIRRFINETNDSERMRREFIANLSHEMRTPLTIIRGYAEAIFDGVVTGEQGKRSIAIIRDESLRLERLIKDMLELSKLQLAKFELELEEMPLSAAVKYASDKMRDKIRAKGIALKYNDSSEDAVILADYNRLIQVIMILLDNAVKFTESNGFISIDITAVADKVKVRICDSGCGISKEDLPNIWERFYKADKSHNRGTEGLGLGLAIAREIADKHKAAVDVTSSTSPEDHGTCFYIIFDRVAACRDEKSGKS